MDVVIRLWLFFLSLFFPFGSGAATAHIVSLCCDQEAQKQTFFPQTKAQRLRCGVYTG